MSFLFIKYNSEHLAPTTAKKALFLYLVLMHRTDYKCILSSCKHTCTSCT